MSVLFALRGLLAANAKRYTASQRCWDSFAPCVRWQAWGLLATGLLFAVLRASVVFAEENASPVAATRGSWGQPYSDRWGVERIGLDASAATSEILKAHCPTPQPVIVAVLDTGIDYLHPDLPRERLWVNPKEKLNGLDDDQDNYVDDLIGWNFVDDDNNPWDDSGHGTVIAGIIAATGKGRNSGVNPYAQIMPLKVLNALGAGRSSDVAAAIDFAIAHGARVINLSLGAEQLSDVEQHAVRRAMDAGLLVVVAAGNQGRDTSGYGLAGLDGVLTVAASDTRDQRARFSNFGRAVKVAAPGVDILSLRARGSDFIASSGAAHYRAAAAIVGEDGRYYRASGTSFAAAMVSGLASYVLSCRPDLTGVEVGRMIVQSARDIGPPGIDPGSGYGLIDARAALAADPKFWIQAEIESAAPVTTETSATIRVIGSADASAFAGAKLRVAPEAFPDDWIDVGAPITKPVHGAPLGEFDARVLHGSRRWIFQLVTQTSDGRSRETRLAVDLGAAP